MGRRAIVERNGAVATIVVGDGTRNALAMNGADADASEAAKRTLYSSSS